MKNASVYKANFSNIARCIFFIVIFIPAIAYAQKRGTVEVIKDPRIDTFIARRSNLKVSHVAAKTIATAVPPITGTAAIYLPITGPKVQINGFRVQIFTGSDRKDAYDMQAKFQEKYPGVRTYITYIEPDFKVRVGDMRTRLEAEKLMQELRKDFVSLFIIQEKINIPKVNTPNDKTTDPGTVQKDF